MRQEEGAAPRQGHGHSPATQQDDEASAYRTSATRTVNSRSRSPLRCICRAVLLAAAITIPWLCVVGIWYAVNQAPNTAIPIIVASLLVVVSGLLYQEVRR